jgi:hypothetical protein
MKYFYFYLIFFSIIIGCDQYREKETKRIRPQGVPPESIWSGGIDGGHWFQNISRSNDTLRYCIYSDYDGDLIVDAYFKLEVDDKYLNIIDYETIVLNSYNGFDITCSYNSDTIDASLVKIKPVLGGYEREIFDEYGK